MEDNQVVDQQQRTDALDPTRSFIVQAPAGSGKTEILTQRFLCLLSRVDKAPEQVVAITFTKKAAAEMRARIHQSLLKAKNTPEPEALHAKTTWKLAQNVLQRDQKEQWGLVDNPNRLRVMTIDALCARITRSAPLLTQFGSQPDVMQDSSRCYTNAARTLISTMYDSPALHRIMLHLDNNQQWVEELFVSMLSRRDQWLPYVMGGHQREHLEEGLANAVQDIIKRCRAHVPGGLATQLLPLIQYADDRLGVESLLAWPDDEIDDWRKVAMALLSKSGELRKTVTAPLGFPPKTEEKAQMLECLKLCEQHPDFIECLQDVLFAPPVHYTDQQWQIIEALLEILPLLAAQLKLQFRKKGAVDFIEVSEAAIRALGTHESPTDVALNLDYQIQHLLVDEFQDTSVTQYRLLELLTAGWQADDGRSLFIVGDPMQSIYRFREAEVGLFLRSRHYGLGHLPLDFLQLKTNFRSTDSVISWINTHFDSVFPQEENIATGAVPYSDSVAFDRSTDDGVTMHALFEDECIDVESEQIVNIIQKHRQKNANERIAILVRSRTHLLNILPALKRSNIKYLAVEVEKLTHSVVIQDLLSLTRALLHLNDRIAWLAVLRAPWCGLLLPDLHAVGRQRNKTILEAALHAQCSEDGSKRLEKTIKILQHAVDNRQRQPLHLLVKTTWQQLGGPPCLQDESEYENADTFFKMLSELEDGVVLPEVSQLEHQLNSLFASADTDADPNLQIMTIHKSKGLEFDTVILPGLERRPASDDSSLLLSLERPRSDEDETDLLLAPIKYVGDDYDSIYRYVRRQHNKKADYESIRLLYVAATRAKKSLHLLGTVSKDLKAPASKSFLGLLWDGVQHEFTENQNNIPTSTNIMVPEVKTNLTRLPISEFATVAITPVQYADNTINIELDETARHVGTVIHSALQQIAETGQHDNDSQRWKNQLLALNVPFDTIDTAVATISRAIDNTLADEKGRWILANTHADAHCEYPLSYVENGEVIHLVLDRTFIDADGIRWIIDYKTSAEAKVEYTEQLQRYAKAMSCLEQRPTRCALYFPLTAAFVEV